MIFLELVREYKQQKSFKAKRSIPVLKSPKKILIS